MVGLIVSALFILLFLSLLWRDRRQQPEPVLVKVPKQTSEDQ
jgi:hypothetical protein